MSPTFLRTSFQPIVDLRTGGTVGFEALARWPELHVTPADAFALAARTGRTVELDWACQAAALRAATAGGLFRSHTLFINAEPAALCAGPSPALAEEIAAIARHAPVVVEITERGLLSSPGALLRACEQVRALGWGLALDDVGATPEGLAALPFIAPDVIKLDLQLVQHWPDAVRAQLTTAVMAHAEQSGAVLLAEGIETEDHLELAVALGATLGQGWNFAAAGPLATGTAAQRVVPLVLRGVPPQARTPFELVEPGALRVARKELLLGLSHHLERQSRCLEHPPVVLGAYQHESHFTASVSSRYATLARHCALVVAAGEGMHADPAPGVHGASLDPSDPLCGQWAVIVVGTHYAGALIGRDLGDTGADLDRRFEFIVTHHRPTVIAAGRSILDRLPTGRPR
jgi:EAL domain-containing protein (putative c-di-GMP-specific phosphodiesterase class I)